MRLVGHSYGGMVISHMPARLPGRIRRLVYWNAFVPQPGECLNDLVPPHYRALFDQVAASSGNAVMLPYPIWREAFINDADEALAQSTYALLNPHPYRTFTEPAQLPVPLAALEVGKSYLNAQQDTALPHSLPWHPRLSERLGLFRLVECPGSHELCFSDPASAALAHRAGGARLTRPARVLCALSFGPFLASSKPARSVSSGSYQFRSDSAAPLPPAAA